MNSSSSNFLQVRDDFKVSGETVKRIHLLPREGAANNVVISDGTRRK